ncbi:MAG TPA: HipA domain-containing protein, partial [Burkholderiales bacterium]|nr:HipA domain-containing protein [Burkholderiales bacterium]
DGGPGLARLFSLAAQFVTGWPRARPALISWVIFNYLIGNRDTHAKNLSLTITRDRVKLAPFYDLLSTAIYPGGEKELSLKIGGQARAHAVRREHWRRFAQDIATEWPLVERLARDLAAELPVHAQEVIAGMRFDREEQRCVEKIVRLIVVQSRHLGNVLRSS